MTDQPLAATLVERLDRMESTEALRQLAFTYALAVDARDLDLLVSLYVDDVRTADGPCRAALKAVFDKSLRQFTTSSHLVSNHLIEFIDPDNAFGLVSCRIEHEVGSEWVTMVSLYHDRYERRAGRWYFRGRIPARLYATAEDDLPLGDNKLRWPGGTPMVGNFHDSLPSWSAFWGEGGGAAYDAAAYDVAADAARDTPITRLRGTPRLPPAPPFFF